MNLLLLATGCTIPDTMAPVYRGTTTNDVPIVAAPAVDLLINEVMAANDSAWQPDGRLPDWVEVLYLGSEPLELSRISLSDGSGARWHGPPGTFLEAGQRWVVQADDGQTVDGAPFRISSDSDALRLEVDEVLVDGISVDDLPSDTSLARHPDGGTWAVTTWFTPGQANPAVPSPTVDPSDALFASDAVLQLDLTVADELMDDLNVKDGPGVSASMTFEGVTLPVTVKLKGGGSFVPLPLKAAFKIDINDEVPGQRLRGLKGITLNNGEHDPTFARESLTYDVFAASGIPAPRVGWMNVSLNGDDLGLHVHVETWDDLLLSRWFDDADGLLLEGNRDADLGGNALAYDVDRGAWDNDFFLGLAAVLADPESPEAMAQLESYVDVDQFVTYAAVEAVTMHWDGYQKPNNYHLYLDPTSQRLQWLPHGTDWTWMKDYDLEYGEGDVLQFCLRVPSCTQRFHMAVLDVVDSVQAMGLVERFQARADFLRPFIEADPLAPPGWKQDRHTELTLINLRERPRALADAIRD